MPIPGQPVKLEARAKVRVGIKNQRGLPQSVDYFVADDPEVQGQPKTLLITFPHAKAEDNWSDGLEWWVKKRGDQGARPILACYTKGEQDPPIALRVPTFGLEGFELAGEQRSSGRQPIVCTFRDCPQFKLGVKGCRPVGRLQFFIAGGRTDAPLQFESKGWETLEAINRGLTLASARGQDLRGRTFRLHVEFEQRRDKRFPVVTLDEVSDYEVPAGEARARLHERLTQLYGDTYATDRTDVVQWVREVGIDAALVELG